MCCKAAVESGEQKNGQRLAHIALLHVQCASSKLAHNSVHTNNKNLDRWQHCLVLPAAIASSNKLLHVDMRHVDQIKAALLLLMVMWHVAWVSRACHTATCSIVLPPVLLNSNMCCQGMHSAACLACEHQGLRHTLEAVPKVARAVAVATAEAVFWDAFEAVVAIRQWDVHAVACTSSSRASVATHW
jgi:hypothetical protein